MSMLSVIYLPDQGVGVCTFNQIDESIQAQARQPQHKLVEPHTARNKALFSLVYYYYHVYQDTVCMPSSQIKAYT